jgi:hypothetical protein
MRSAEAALLALALALQSALAQSPTTADPNVDSSQPNLYQTFQDESLGFSLTYPARMAAVRLPSADQQHAENARTASFTNMPAKCFNVVERVFAAERHEKGRPAHVYVTRYGLSCFPDALEQVENGQPIFPQIGQPCSREGDTFQLNLYAPAGYHIGTRRAYFAEAEWEDSLSHEGRIWTAEVQFIAAESLIMIEIDSDDHELFGEILKGQLTIGEDSASLLASGFNPTEIHSPDIRRCSYTHGLERPEVTTSQ